MLNTASSSARPAPADFLPEDDGSAAKSHRIKIGKASEDSDKKVISLSRFLIYTQNLICLLHCNKCWRFCAIVFLFLSNIFIVAYLRPVFSKN